MNVDTFRGYFRFTPELAVELINELEVKAQVKAEQNGLISNDSDEKKYLLT